jgi:hypothetical protein
MAKLEIFVSKQTGPPQIITIANQLEEMIEPPNS